MKLRFVANKLMDLLDNVVYCRWEELFTTIDLILRWRPTRGISRA